MKPKTIQISVLFAGLLFFFANPAFVSAVPYENMDSDRTFSPYFFVKSEDPETDRLPLKSTKADVHIAGVIADVRVTQVYRNEGKNPLEAVYVFPASTRAAVYAMKMTVGERTIVAEVKERRQAREAYENAKQAGQSASLLEQHRPNVFQMNVANILPGDVIRVELSYTELLIPVDAVYEFVYPTVVGPRYVDSPETGGGSSENWTANPYLHQNEPPTYDFGMSVTLSAGLPIQEVACSSHKISTNYQGLARASVVLDPSETGGGNRDFILKYRLAGRKIETGLLLFQGMKENFFLLMMQPPKSVAKIQIPPREYIFIVDVSGSMNGFPLDISKTLLRDLISNLRPTDRFNVLLFAGGSRILSERSLPATSENIRHAVHTIERQRGGGGTRLLPALNRALRLPKAEGFSRTIVVATDGYVSVEKEAFDVIRNNLGRANLFAFGIGSSVNRHLIEGMARMGMGEPFVITRPDQAAEKAGRFRKMIASPVASQITVDYGQFEVYDVEPPHIPDVMADRPVVVFGKWRGTPKGEISVRGFSGDGSFIKTLNTADFRPAKDNAALRYLWARHRIALLSDYNRLGQDGSTIKEITNLGLSYNLLTAYTSFVAIDTRVRLENGQAVTVKQPLPLPQGVSDLAVGGKRSAKLAVSSHAMPRLSKTADEAVKQEYDAVKPISPSEGKTDREEETGNETRLRILSVTVDSGLNNKAAKQMIIRNKRLLAACLGDAVKKDDRILIRLQVDASGRITDVAFEKGSVRLTHQGWKQCMVRGLKALRFPATETGNGAVVRVSLVVS